MSIIFRKWTFWKISSYGLFDEATVFTCGNNCDADSPATNFQVNEKTLPKESKLPDIKSQASKSKNVRELSNILGSSK